MYRYDEFDERFVNERVAQFRRQVQRRLKGELTEDQFRPLRLMNGLYLQQNPSAPIAPLSTVPAPPAWESFMPAAACGA